jgi:hypothetical protein
MAIDLFFVRDDALVLRLSSCNLRKREATDFYLRINNSPWRLSTRQASSQNWIKLIAKFPPA